MVSKSNFKSPNLYRIFIGSRQFSSTLTPPQIDGIVFELVKTRHEAKMELTISPITFLFSDSFKRPTLDMHLAHGFLQLQGINVLMCGLYSGVGQCFSCVLCVD